MPQYSWELQCRCRLDKAILSVFPLISFIAGHCALTGWNHDWTAERVPDATIIQRVLRRLTEQETTPNTQRTVSIPIYHTRSITWLDVRELTTGQLIIHHHVIVTMHYRYSFVKRWREESKRTGVVALGTRQWSVLHPWFRLVQMTLNPGETTRMEPRTTCVKKNPDDMQSNGYGFKAVHNYNMFLYLVRWKEFASSSLHIHISSKQKSLYNGWFLSRCLLRPPVSWNMLPMSLSRPFSHYWRERQIVFAKVKAKPSQDFEVFINIHYMCVCFALIIVIIIIIARCFLHINYRHQRLTYIIVN